MIFAACFTLRGEGTYRFTVVFICGQQDLPSDGRTFSLISFDA